ncbi:MAG: CPBP family intramembrane metalloprotease [Clostridia bacterium]|nr:CPBP family intramembrane metalloprotease [Clostridia bacterium]
MNDLSKKYEDIKRIKGARWLLLWVMLTQFVLRIASAAIVSFLPKAAEGFIRYQNYIQLGIVTLLTFIVPIMVYGVAFWRKTDRTDAEEMRFNKIPKKLTGFIVLMAISGQFVMALLNLPLGKLFGAENSGLVPQTGGEVLAALIVTAFLPGVLEEFWMRGIILSVYERRSTFVAIAFTTIMFALLHGSITKFPGVLLLGLVAAIITIRTNSVYAAMLYHIINNATSVLFGYFAIHYEIGDVFTWTLAAIMVLLFIASFICFLIVAPKKKRNKCKNEGTMLLKNFLSVPVILCLIVVLLQMRFRG